MAGTDGSIGFPEISLSDPSTWIPTFGDWGGPNWSAGQRDNTMIRDERLAAPVQWTPGADGVERPSPLDIAYYDAERIGGADEAILKLKADLQLMQDIADLPWADLTGEEITYATSAAALFAEKIALVDPALIDIGVLQAAAEALLEQIQSLVESVGNSHADTLIAQSAALTTPPPTPATTRTIEGDLKPVETEVVVDIRYGAPPPYDDPTKWKFAGARQLDSNTYLYTFYELDDLGNAITEQTAVLGLNDILNGSSGNDHIISGDGTDFITATQGGDDFIDAGADIYIYNRGDGADNIRETTSGNILRFGAGINQNDISLKLGSLMLDLGPSTGSGQAGSSAIVRTRWRACAATVNSKAANNEEAKTWRVAA